MRKTLIDLTGQTFDRLKVIGRAPNRKNITYWKCECSCDNHTIVEVAGTDLRRGHTRSCGCLHREVSRDRMTKYQDSQGNEIHNMSDTKLYKVWSEINSICKNENNGRYKYYGERGINICKEWEDSFLAFYNWAMQNGYKDGLILGRIDTKKNFEPSNCVWSAFETFYKKQNNNKESNRRLQFNGMIKTVSEWCDEFNMNYNTLIYRLNAGWSVEEALTTPVRHKRR